MQPFLCGPPGGFDARSRPLTAQPTFGLFFNLRERRRTGLRSTRRNSRLVNPLVDRNSRRERGVLIQKVLLEISNELLGRDALESEMIEVAAQETIKTRASE